MTSSKNIRSITSHKFVTYRIRSCVVSWDCGSSFWDQRNMSMHPAERSPGAGGSTALHVLGQLAIPQGFEWTDIQWLLWSDLFDKHTRYERYYGNHVWKRLCQIVYFHLLSICRMSNLSFENVDNSGTCWPVPWLIQHVRSFCSRHSEVRWPLCDVLVMKISHLTRIDVKNMSQKSFESSILSYPRLSWMVRSPFRSSSLRITKSQAHQKQNNALPSSYGKLISVASGDHRKATCYVIPVVGETSGEYKMSYDISIIYIIFNNQIIIWLWYHISSYFHHVAQS